MPLPYSDYRDGASSEPVKVQDAEPDYLEMCADDLNHAIKADDTKGIAAALRAAFDLLDSEPHVEGPHTNEE
jgi:hypothetical protein